MITYCSLFIPNFATITDPLRSLLKKDSDWVWTEIISTIQKAVIETMAYYDLNSYTKIVTDVPLLVFCAVIVQRQPGWHLRPISYASCFLTSVEKRYSQIEKEALRIVFAIECFWIYLYGLHFVVKTDHKPHVFHYLIQDDATSNRTLDNAPYALQLHHRVSTRPSKWCRFPIQVQITKPRIF